MTRGEMLSKMADELASADPYAYPYADAYAKAAALAVITEWLEANLRAASKRYEATTEYSEEASALGECIALESLIAITKGTAP